MDKFLKRWWHELAICLFLIVSSLAVYGQIVNHDFVNYDDPKYITENQHVRVGLTWEGIVWSFTFSDKEKTYWHPLTWLSHMLDCELYGLNPIGHHWTNLLFHITNTLLLFFIFRKMTGAVWPSAFVAALFALHPLNVESVAWASERKNVLSTFFWMLTVFGYDYYCRRPGFLRYLLILFVFALGLLAKPVLVTLPCVLLLLDYWPLERFQFGQVRVNGNEKANLPTYSSKGSFFPRIFLEKVPFFVLSGLSICLSAFSLQHQGALISTESVPMKLRMANALVSYVRYMEKLIWPQDLAVLYLFPKHMLPVWQVVGAGLLLICIFVLVILTLKRMPYLSVGWLWYVGTLVPVIGLVQGGIWPAMADRFTYIPLTGLFIVITWGISDLFLKWRYRVVLLSVFAGIVLLVLVVCTFFQVGHWKDTVTLFENAVRVTDNNGPAHNNLGNALSAQGEFEKAHFHLQTALKINPRDAMVVFNLGKNRYDQGNIEEAIDYYNKTLKINPGHAGAHNNLGSLLAEKGEFDEAVFHFQAALKTKPDFSDARNNLATALSAQGKIDKAVLHLNKTLEINPEDAVAHMIFGNLLMVQDKLDEAMTYFAETVRIKPDHAEAYDAIGCILARQGKLKGAEIFFSRAVQINPNFSKARKHLEENRKQLSKTK